MRLLPRSFACTCSRPWRTTRLRRRRTVPGADQAKSSASASSKDRAVARARWSHAVMQPGSNLQPPSKAGAKNGRRPFRTMNIPCRASSVANLGRWILVAVGVDSRAIRTMTSGTAGKCAPSVWSGWRPRPVSALRDRGSARSTVLAAKGTGPSPPPRPSAALQFSRTRASRSSFWAMSLNSQTR